MELLGIVEKRTSMKIGVVAQSSYNRSHLQER
jgi:hypothetical protein